MPSEHADEPDRPRCPACGRPGLREFLDAGDAPVHCNVLWPEREAALAAPQGPLRLSICGACAMVCNPAFDERLAAYAQGYENSLHFSAVFRAYAEQLAEDLVRRHGVRGGEVMDVGCGDGHFLGLLCAAGGNRGVGYDPSQPATQGATANGGSWRIVPEPYTPGHGAATADLACARHVLEHVAQPCAFLDGLRATLSQRAGAVVYVELPDAGFMLRENAFWDVIYEHCGYFSAPSLRTVMARAGLRPLAMSSVFAGQFLAAEATPDSRYPVGSADPEEVAELGALADGFAARRAQAVRHWATTLGQLRGEGRRVVLWGAGSKGVALLHATGTRDEVSAVVDINPRKHGRHVPGTGHRVLAPAQLRELAPDVVVLLNANYAGEVAATLADLDLDPLVMEVSA